MADHSPTHFTGPTTIEALTADREKMWHGFTTATTVVVIAMIIGLILMAFFTL